MDPQPWRFGTGAGDEAPPPWLAGCTGAELAPSCCLHRKGGSIEHASSSIPSWEPAREEGGFVFLLPSLPFGSASGGKTQPLLHPSPPDQDERGVLMQSSWTALPRSRQHRSGPDHQHTGTAGRRLWPPAPPTARGGSPGSAGLWGAGAAPAPPPRPDPPPLCLHPSGLPDAAEGWASPGLCSFQPCPLREGWGAGGGSWAPPALHFGFCQGFVFALGPPVPAGKALGRDRGRQQPPSPTGCSRQRGFKLIPTRQGTRLVGPCPTPESCPALTVL